MLMQIKINHYITKYVLEFTIPVSITKPTSNFTISKMTTGTYGNRINITITPMSN